VKSIKKYRKSENSIDNTEKLLYDADVQKICINTEKLKER